jgi:hypothetical protein
VPQSDSTVVMVGFVSQGATCLAYRVLEWLPETHGRGETILNS